MNTVISANAKKISVCYFYKFYAYLESKLLPETLKQLKAAQPETSYNKRLFGSSARTLCYLMFKGLALSPTLWFMSYVASVPRLLWRKQACCSSRRFTVIGGQILPAGNSAFTTTSTSLDVVRNTGANARARVKT